MNSISLEQFEAVTNVPFERGLETEGKLRAPTIPATHQYTAQYRSDRHHVHLMMLTLTVGSSVGVAPVGSGVTGAGDAG